MYRLVALVVVLVSLGPVGPGLALAQDATPATGAFPVIPDPARCQVEARQVVEFLAITAAATPGAAAPVGTAVEVPLGVAADAEMVAGVTATAGEILACFNAGDFLRAFSLFSDNAVRRFIEVDPISEEELRSSSEAIPEAAPTEQQSTLLALTDVMELEDGRVGAFLATTDPFVGPDTVYIVFVQQDGRWLVDDIIEFLEPA